MRGLLIRAQFGLMRLIGMRKLREALDAKVDATQSDVVARLDVLQTASGRWVCALDDRLSLLEGHLAAIDDQLSRQGRSATERGDTDQNSLRGIERSLVAIGDQLSRQGGAATERGDTDQNTFRDLQRKIEELLRRDGGASQALGELRAEMSGIRADFARELELLTDQTQSRGSDDLQRGLDDVRTELSVVRADLARMLEALMPRTGEHDHLQQAFADGQTEPTDKLLGEMLRVEPSSVGSRRNYPAGVV